MVLVQRTTSRGVDRLNGPLTDGTLPYKALGARDAAEAEKARGQARPEAMMSKWLRRIRGAIGIGFSWGVAWAVAGIVLAVATGFQADVPFPLVFGVLGFFAGVTFSAFLALTQGRRRFDQMSLPRFAAWGAIGGLLLSAIFATAASLGWGDLLTIAPTFALASAVCASGSLAVARRAASRELPNVRHDTAQAEIADHEQQKLP